MNNIDYKKILISEKINDYDSISNYKLVQLIYNNCLSFLYLNNQKDRNNYTALFNKRLHEINVADSKLVRFDENDEEAYGYFSVDDEKMDVIFGGINNKNNTNLKTVYSNATHEMLHAIINNNIKYLGNDKCFYRNRYGIYSYDQFNRINYYPKKGATTSSDALYELTNELLSCIIVDKYLMGKKDTLDNFLTTNFTKKELTNSSYMKLIPIVKLLAAAFNNDFQSTDHQIIGRNSLMTRMIVMNDGEIRPANTYIYDMITNPIEFVKKYDYYMGSNATFKLYTKLNKLLKTSEANKQDKDYYLDIKNIMFQIALLDRKRNSAMLNNGKIDDDQFLNLEMTFNQAFLTTQDNYNIKISDKNIAEFNNTCNKIDDNEKNFKKIKIKKMNS